VSETSLTVLEESAESTIGFKLNPSSPKVKRMMRRSLQNLSLEKPKLWRRPKEMLNLTSKKLVIKLIGRESTRRK
jgi:hypothetical protein